MPESVRLCPFHMPFGIPYNLTGDLLALPTIDKRSLHNSITSLVYIDTKELMIHQPILLLVSAKGIS